MTRFHEDPNEHDAKRSRLLYWWRNPSSDDDSAEMGRYMLKIAIVWFVSIVLFLLVVAALFAL